MRRIYPHKYFLKNTGKYGSIFSADIHQGDERFSVHCRGKQCAFMSLSALLTARNIPLNSWSRITFKNALLQGDKMFLNALDSGFIILDQGVELLSVENLPTVVNVACCTNLFQNDFSYKICQMPVQAETTASPVMVTNNDLHIFEEPCEVQNNILETQTYSTELTTQSKTSPMRVIDTTSPVRVTNTTSPVRVTDTDLPIVVQPVEAKTIIDPPIVVEPIGAITIIDSPIVVEPIEAQIVIKTKNTIDMSDEAENENQICSINYGAEFQGLVITDREIERSNFDHKLDYMKQAPQKSRRNRQRNIIWFNPPFSKNVKTNIARNFLCLIDKHFPPNHKLHKIFNRNTVKVSYSCMNNVKSIISKHNTRITGKSKPQCEVIDPCTCRDKKTCPPHEKCMTKDIVYKATITTSNTNSTKHYIGMTASTFKERYRNHIKSFNHKRYSNDTELSKYIWKLKDNKQDFDITWSVLKQSISYTGGSKRCNLCLEEKLCILKDKNKQNLLKKKIGNSFDM